MTERAFDDFFDDELALEEEAEGKVAAEDVSAAAPGAETAAATGDAADAEGAAPASDVSAAGATAATEAAVSASDAPARQAPPFWMVLVITAIALLLGVIIGYLLGSSAAMSSLASAQADAAAQQTADTASDDASYALPEGHPQVEVDTDGTAHVAE